MNCLNDFIGLTGCTVATPASGLFINSLPGISLKSIEQLADAEQQTYVGVWNDVQVRAQSRLLMDVRSQFNNRYKIATARKQVKIEEKNAPKTGDIVSGSSHYHGIIIDQAKNLSDGYKVSALQGIHIDTITINKPLGATSFELLISDADTGLILLNTTVTGSSYSVNETYYNNRIFVGGLMDSEEYEDTPFNESINEGCCLNITGATYLGSGTTFTETENNSYGLWLNIGLRCSVENLICNNKDVFQYAYWYLLGSELMMERMVSERINKWTIDKAQAEELKAHYDVTYEKAIKQAVEGINLNTNDACIECDPPIAVREARL